MEDPQQNVFWPKALDQKMADVAMEHRKLGRDVQTLAFVCGHEDREGNIIANHLVIPNQIEDPATFEDRGMITVCLALVL